MIIRFRTSGFSQAETINIIWEKSKQAPGPKIPLFGRVIKRGVLETESIQPTWTTPVSGAAPTVLPSALDSTTLTPGH